MKIMRIFEILLVLLLIARKKFLPSQFYQQDIGQLLHDMGLMVNINIEYEKHLIE